MSHFDDIEPIFYGGGASTMLGAIVFLFVALGAVYWACYEDGVSKQMCESHGERYVDSRENYTLCEQDGGTVVRR